MTSPQSVLRSLFITALLLFMAVVAPVTVSSAPPQPTYAIADVDGNAGEWNLTTDFFAEMRRGQGTNGPLQSRLYLRYHCNTQTLYALVLPEPGFSLIIGSGGDHYIKFGSGSPLVEDEDGDNNATPDMNFIGASGTSAQGWEASAFVAPGTYTNLNVHAQVLDPQGGSQTSAVANRAIPLTIICPPLSVALSSFEADARASDVLVTWETASETDNVGFNLYRAASPTGERTRLNSEMIPSQAPGGGGAAYEWVDSTVSTPSIYYYWLETVDLTGGTELHGPVDATFPASPTAVTVSTFSTGTATPYVLFGLTGIALLGSIVAVRVWERTRKTQG